MSLANGVTVEKALAKLKAASNKKAKQEQKQRWAGLSVRCGLCTRARCAEVKMLLDRGARRYGGVGYSSNTVVVTVLDAC